MFPIYSFICKHSLKEYRSKLTSVSEKWDPRLGSQDLRLLAETRDPETQHYEVGTATWDPQFKIRDPKIFMCGPGYKTWDINEKFTSLKI